METKQKILDIALQLFASKGYLGTSMSDLANELGITKGALYKHYASKQDIFDSILKKMNQEDAVNASKYNLPVNDFCGDVSISKLCDYALGQFLFWTEDAFASSFRKMLTIEQYKSDDMQNLYQQYLANGQLNYVEEVFRSKGFDNAKQKAFEFFSPLFLCYHLVDGKVDKKEIFATLQSHFDNFCKNVNNKV